jgi:osmotically-inducible protein OsmY
MANRNLVAALLLSALALNGCAAPFIAAGAAGAGTGVAATRSGGLGQTYTDTQISNSVHSAWSDYNPNMLDDLSYKVFEGRVMIVGSTPRSEFRDEAVKLTWQAEGVRQVINEIHVEAKPTFSDNARDSWISTQFKTRLISDRGIQLINFTFITSNSVIYVIGVARDQEELNLVLNHARNISYVKDVVSYIRMNGTDRPSEGPSSGNVQNSAPASTSSTSSAPKSNSSTGYSSSNGPVTDSDNAVGSSYSPPASAADISSTDLPPVK